MWNFWCNNGSLDTSLADDWASKLWQWSLMCVYVWRVIVIGDYRATRILKISFWRFLWNTKKGVNLPTPTGCPHHKLAPFCTPWLWQILSDFQYYFTVRIMRKFVIILSPKIPPHLVLSLSGANCHNVSLIAPFVSGVAGLSASSSSKADTLNIWRKNAGCDSYFGR